MKYYFFSTENNTIDKPQKVGLGNASQYTHYEKIIGVEEIYYKMKDGKIVTVMCEALDYDSAKKAVDRFLSSL
jgi:hypothetical protein